VPTSERDEHFQTNEFPTDLYPLTRDCFSRQRCCPPKVTGTALAQPIGATQASIAKVLNGKGPLTPSLAARIEAAIGYLAAFLCRLQTAYDLARARGANWEGSMQFRRLLRRFGAQNDGRPRDAP